MRRSAAATRQQTPAKRSPGERQHEAKEHPPHERWLARRYGVIERRPDVPLQIRLPGGDSPFLPGACYAVTIRAQPLHCHIIEVRRQVRWYETLEGQLDVELVARPDAGGAE